MSVLRCSSHWGLTRGMGSRKCFVGCSRGVQLFVLVSRFSALGAAEMGRHRIFPLCVLDLTFCYS